MVVRGNEGVWATFHLALNTQQSSALVQQGLVVLLLIDVTNNKSASTNSVTENDISFGSIQAE